MIFKKQTGHAEGFRLPRLGQRIVKTSVAVFLCLLFYYLRGYSGRDMPTEAAITAIICMQPYVRDTRDYALSRFAGTLLGAGCGLLFLFLLLLFPVLGQNLLVLYALMALGMMLCLYGGVLLRRPDISGLAAIVFICVVIAFPEINQPLLQALKRITGVLVGTASAIAVNVFRLPRVKRRDQVFFVRTRDLAPNRFSDIPAAALFRLNYLYADGAKICLMSEHAPAFFAMQLHNAMLSVPMIVMDGAALYDARENKYLCVKTLERGQAEALQAMLAGMGLSSRSIRRLDNKIEDMAKRNETLRQELAVNAGDVSVCTEAVKLNLISGYGAQTIQLTAPEGATMTLVDSQETTGGNEPETRASRGRTE